MKILPDKPVQKIAETETKGNECEGIHRGVIPTEHRVWTERERRGKSFQVHQQLEILNPI
jgi:hypothetical protein